MNFLVQNTTSSQIDGHRTKFKFASMRCIFPQSCDSFEILFRLKYTVGPLSLPVEHFLSLKFEMSAIGPSNLKNEHYWSLHLIPLICFACLRD